MSYFYNHFLITWVKGILTPTQLEIAYQKGMISLDEYNAIKDTPQNI